MHAWTFSQAGKPEDILRFNPANPTPPPATGSNVLVRVSYVALSSAYTNLMNDIPSIVRHSAIPEIDFSGFIAQVGPKNRALAEYIIVPTENVIVKPKTVGLSQAAGLTSLAHTAVLMAERAKITAGTRVLVHGGGGDIGSMALQISEDAGAMVVVTCSASKIDMVLQLGAELAIDYQANHPLTSFLSERFGQQQLDVILDTVGSQDLYEQSPSYLSPHGVYVNVGNIGVSTALTLLRWIKNSILPSFLGGVPRKSIQFSGIPTKEWGEKIASLAAEKRLHILVDSAFKLEDALLAYKRMRDGGRKGRCLIEVSP
ncbi:NAD(P)-binding protein [Hyaloscypha variabilis]